jgi:two-component system OmpR family sensor kinase
MRLPLRLRLAASFALSVAVVLTGLGIFLYLRLGAELGRGIDLELRDRAGVIIAAAADHQRVPVEAGRGVTDPDESFAQMLTTDGVLVDASAAVRDAPMLPAVELARITRPTFLTRRVHGVGDPARLLATPMRTSGEPMVVVVGANLGDRDEAQHRLLLLLVVGIPAAVVLASGIGWLVAGAGLRPVEQLRREAAAASALGSGPMLTVPPTGDELARLARTLNELLRRQREAVQAEHRFLDEASHDLRTPLAVLKAELDLALARPRDRSELEQTVRAASGATDQLVRLAEDLLVLARSRNGPLALYREPVRLAAFCAECAAPLRGSGRTIAVSADDVEVAIDPPRARQAVRNLLDNAVRHGAGEVRLTAKRHAAGTVTIVVSDAGPGVPAHLIGRLAPDRPPADGLGLAIVAAIAAAHGGWVEADVRPAGGAEIRLTLGAW